jgi:3D (Asp-Asp-Asp) domain-containing protein
VKEDYERAIARCRAGRSSAIRAAATAASLASARAVHARANAPRRALSAQGGAVLSLALAAIAVSASTNANATASLPRPLALAAARSSPSPLGGPARARRNPAAHATSAAPAAATARPAAGHRGLLPRAPLAASALPFGGMARRTSRPRQPSADVVIAQPPNPAAGWTYLGDFSITCYDLTGVTASGALAGTGGVAVDPRVIPLGTRLYVQGVGQRTADDTGGAILGDRLDIWEPTFSECTDWGVQERAVYRAP